MDNFSWFFPSYPFIQSHLISTISITKQWRCKDVQKEQIEECEFGEHAAEGGQESGQGIPISGLRRQAQKEKDHCLLQWKAHFQNREWQTDLLSLSIMIRISLNWSPRGRALGAWRLNQTVPALSTVRFRIWPGRLLGKRLKWGNHDFSIKKPCSAELESSRQFVSFLVDPLGWLSK